MLATILMVEEKVVGYSLCMEMPATLQNDCDTHEGLPVIRLAYIMMSVICKIDGRSHSSKGHCARGQPLCLAQATRGIIQYWAPSC